MSQGPSSEASPGARPVATHDLIVASCQVGDHVLADFEMFLSTLQPLLNV